MGNFGIGGLAAGLNQGLEDVDKRHEHQQDRQWLQQKRGYGIRALQRNDELGQLKLEHQQRENEIANILHGAKTDEARYKARMIVPQLELKTLGQIYDYSKVDPYGAAELLNNTKTSGVHGAAKIEHGNGLVAAVDADGNPVISQKTGQPAVWNASELESLFGKNKPVKLGVKDRLVNPDTGKTLIGPDPTLAGRDAPKVQTFYDQHGAQYKAQWDPASEKWVRVGGTHASNGLSVTTPDGTTVQMGGSPGSYKTPNGYRLRNVNNPAGGVEPIPGGPADSMNPGNAAKVQMLRQGLDDVSAAEKVIFNPDGSINRTLLAEMETRAPMSNGRKLFSLLYNAVEGKLRAESGAAVPDSEVKRMAQRFVPSVFDNDATVRSKLTRLKQYLGDTLDTIDPTHRFGETQDTQGDPSHMSDAQLLQALGVN